MLAAIHPIDTLASIPPVANAGTRNDVNVTGSSANRIKTFEALLAYQSAQLLSVQNRAATQSDISLLNSDLLNLSPQALNILNGTNGNNATTGLAGLTFFNNANSNLTLEQQQQLAAIVTEFGNAPFTETTFSQIQSALTNAGINPGQISLQAILQEMMTVFIPSSFIDGELLANTDTSDLLAA